MTQRPRLTINEAVDQFQTSRATLRRGIDAGRFPGASKDTTGRWSIPLTDLLAAGIPARKTWLTEDAQGVAHQGAHEQPQSAQNSRKTMKTKVNGELAHQGAQGVTHEHPDTTLLRQRIALLEQRLEQERLLKEAAERNAQDLRSTVRMLENKTSAPLRRWWSRRP